MASESQQKKLSRVRKPRVHITYDVEIGDARVKKELPFVVGVLGDFSGNPTQPLKSFKDRKFVQIDRDNFNDVMARMSPGLKLRVENTLKGDGSEIGVQLKFNSLDDFDPAKIVDQVEPLKKLMETRQKLTELLGKVDLADDFEQQIEDLLKDPAKIKQASGAFNPPAASAPAPAPEPEPSEPSQPSDGGDQ
ncbi:MAG: type VI secretion system contractile sheath small subunit [Pirellulales bacterium]